MTSPVIASRTATLINTATSSPVINLGSPNAGDMLVVVVAIDNATVPIVDHAYSGGQWLILGAAVSSSAVTGILLAKIAEGGGADALRLQLDTIEDGSAMCIRVTGHGSAIFSALTQASSTNADPPNVSITGSAQDLLLITAACWDSNITASAAPSGYGNLTSQASGGVSGASVGVADRAASASTGENPGAFTSSTEQWVAFSIAIPENGITTNARATQVVEEAVSIPNPNARITQHVVEAVSSFANNANITQIVVESVSPQGQDAIVTQMVLEVLSGDPWPSLSNPNKYRQIQIAC